MTTWQQIFLKNGRLTREEWPYPDHYPEDPAGQLALLYLWEKGATLPEIYEGPWTHTPTVEEGPCPPAWAQAWREMSTGGRKELIPEALLLAARAGFSLPAEYMPDLARLGLRDPLLCRRLLPVWGPRGERFLQEVPEYRGLLLDDPGIWNTGSVPLRLAFFTNMRSRDPEAALQIAEDSWSGESLGFRKSIVDALYVGLSPTDMPFLEQRARERSKDLREPAIRWLFLLGADQADPGEGLPEEDAAMLRAVLQGDLPTLLKSIKKVLPNPVTLLEAGRFLRPADWNELALHLLKAEDDLTANPAYAALLERSPLLWTADHAKAFFRSWMEYRLDPLRGYHKPSENLVNRLLQQAAVSAPPELLENFEKTASYLPMPFLSKADPLHRFFDTLEFRNQLRNICLKK